MPERKISGIFICYITHVIPTNTRCGWWESRSPHSRGWPCNWEL